MRKGFLLASVMLLITFASVAQAQTDYGIRGTRSGCFHKLAREQKKDSGRECMQLLENLRGRSRIERLYWLHGIPRRWKNSSEARRRGCSRT